MKLAVNYSVPLDNLLSQGLVELDLLKCPEWDGVVKAGLKLKPVYIHFDISAGNGSVTNLDFDLIRRMLKMTDTPHLNCHLAADPALDPKKPADMRRLVKVWKSEMQYLRAQVEGCPLVAENLPCAPYMPGSEIGSNPELIREALDSLGVDLLLDLSHARITAANLGLDYQEYIHQLPVERLAELHITGIRPYRSYLTDHFEMRSEDWEAAGWAAEQIASHAWREPEIVAFEYGGIGDVFGWRSEEWVLKEQIPRLNGMFSGGTG
ncbi:MAG: DUF692 family multinuclear iron-containing protein [Anaerolineaceae bacterium]